MKLHRPPSFSGGFVYPFRYHPGSISGFIHTTMVRTWQKIIRQSQESPHLTPVREDLGISICLKKSLRFSRVRLDGFGMLWNDKHEIWVFSMKIINSFSVKHCNSWGIGGAVSRSLEPTDLRDLQEWLAAGSQDDLMCCFVHFPSAGAIYREQERILFVWNKSNKQSNFVYYSATHSVMTRWVETYTCSEIFNSKQKNIAY